MPQHISSAMALTGCEARTVLIRDTQLASNPPVQATMADAPGRPAIGPCKRNVLAPSLRDSGVHL